MPTGSMPCRSTDARNDNRFNCSSQNSRTLVFSHVYTEKSRVFPSRKWIWISSIFRYKGSSQRISYAAPYKLPRNAAMGLTSPCILSNRQPPLKSQNNSVYSPCFFFCSISLSSTRRILPEIVFGSVSTNSISRGYLYGAVTFLTCSCNSLASSGEAAYPGARMT